MSSLIPMPKIAWVALPLLLAAAMLAVQMLRGRRPSRQAINVVASVLLLAYVATTAGLGIFWVANQQLPVFDWHYLFGYGTVLLVALHLAFNFPVVWRFLSARRTKVTADARAAGSLGPPPAARRGVLAALGVLAATGAAFLLGLRHGRSELAIGQAPDREGHPGASATAPAASALAGVERFHAFSSHSRAGLVLRAPAVDWGDPPAPFKREGGAHATRLPAPGPARAAVFDLAALADILWHTAGVTATRGGLHLRASPSSGALFSTELYVAARAVPGLAAGLWHYDPQAHALAPWGDTVAAAALAGTVADDAMREAPALVVATAIFRRTGHKYRDRTYRYVLTDLGHALENLRVAAGAVGANAKFAAAFDESVAAQALRVDESEEGVLALVGVGAPAVSPVPRASVPPAPLAHGVGQRWLAPSLPASGATLGVTAAVHAATSLRAASVPSSLSVAAPRSQAPRQATLALPPAATGRPDVLTLIARRRSVRRYASAPLSLQALADALSRMALHHGPIFSAAVRVNLVVHEVAGLAPGAYRYAPERHALAPRLAPAKLRAAARAAALDQDVVGDAAVVFVLSIERAVFAADPLGPARGYRHALLEAGIVGERVYLEAAAQGLGACAVGAFYDDEAAALVGLDPAREWVVHFAALGVRP